MRDSMSSQIAVPQMASRNRKTKSMRSTVLTLAGSTTKSNIAPSLVRT